MLLLKELITTKHKTHPSNEPQRKGTYIFNEAHPWQKVQWRDTKGPRMHQDRIKDLTQRILKLNYAEIPAYNTHTIARKII